MRALRLTFVAILVSSLTASAQIASGPFPIAAPRIGLAPRDRDNAHVAASDDQFLVVWDDGREENSRPRVWASRVSRTGTLLDAQGFPLDAPGHEYSRIVQSVVSDGTDFIVVVRRDSRHRFIKVTSEGVVQNLSDSGLPKSFSNLVWMGDYYALFFVEPDSMSRGQAVILDRDWRVLTPAHDVVSTTGSVYDLTASVAKGASRAAIAWLDGNDKRVHVSTTPVSTLREGHTRIAASPTLQGEATSFSFAIASSGSRYFIAWTEANEYRGRLFDEEGSPAGEVLTLYPHAFGEIDVAWNGSRFVIGLTAFRDGERAPVVAEVDANSVLVTPASERAGTRCGFDISVASIGGNTILVWESWDTTGALERDQIRADVLDGTSSFLDPGAALLISQSVPWRGYIDAVWRGDHYLAAWSETNDHAHAVLGRFDAEGRLLDGAGRVLGNPEGAQTRPSMATDGRDALVVWREYYELHVAHVAANGQITERTVDGFQGGPGTPAVVWNGQDYVVHALGALVRFASDGTLREKVDLPRTAEDASLVWTGSHYVVFWIKVGFCFPSCDPDTALWAQTISSALTPLGTARRLAYPDVAEDARPIATMADDKMLLVYPERKADQHMLRGIRITASGTVLDSTNGFEIGPSMTVSDVFANGENWTVVAGPNAWDVSTSGHAGERKLLYPFVREGFQSVTVFGGPARLVIYQADNLPQLYGRFVLSPKRRAVRR